MSALWVLPDGTVEDLALEEDTDLAERGWVGMRLELNGGTVATVILRPTWDKDTRPLNPYAANLIHHLNGAFFDQMHGAVGFAELDQDTYVSALEFLSGETP